MADNNMKVATNLGKNIASASQIPVLSIQAYAEAMESIIKDAILASSGPQAALKLIADAIEVKITSPTTALILVRPVMKSSIYDVVGAGKKYGEVNISLVYNHRKWIKPAMVYGGSMDGVFRLSGGMLVGYYNNYVGRAVLEFNGLYGAQCIAVEV